MAMDILEGLNEAQQQAITSPARHLLIVAGPGTGKTLTIARRAARLISRGVNPEGIAAVTFTNRAAREMRERLVGLLGRGAGGMFAGTFHLLGLTIMREALGPGFSICTRDEQVDLLKGIRGQGLTAEQLAQAISRIKNGIDAAEGTIRDAYESYEALLRGRNLYDFDDLVRVPSALLESGCAGRGRGSRLTHLIVDEYQDINPLQRRFLKCLLAGTGSLCAVGDPDQAIYAFRGADVRSFIDFREDYPEAVTVVLDTNYRSGGTILRAAESMIGNNRTRIDKGLVPARDEGRRIVRLSVADERAEAEMIARNIETRMGGTSHYRQVMNDRPVDYGSRDLSFADFAVLFRTHAQARPIREVLESWGIPFQVVGDTPFSPAAAGAALRACLEAGPDEGLADLLRKAWADAGRPPDEGLMEYLAATYSHLPLSEAVSAVEAELALVTGNDAYDRKADRVTLVTLHGAKGLEFRVVFIAGVEQGLIPYGTEAVPPEIEEERRLFYVGMTRAKDELILLHARDRTLYGRRTGISPSPFLAEIPQEHVTFEVVGGRRKARAKQGDLF